MRMGLVLDRAASAVLVYRSIAVILLFLFARALFRGYQVRRMYRDAAKRYDIVCLLTS